MSGNELFHRQLKTCEQEEQNYFLEHDEYSILKRKFSEMMDKYSTTFGVSIITSGNNYYVGNFKENREITMDEIKDMLAKYEQLSILVEKLTEETQIVY